KFIQSDGGWDRVVWMPKHLKDRVLADIPADIAEKVATEEDAADLDSLKNFLTEKDHPIVQRWEEEAEDEPEDEEEVQETAKFAAPPMMQNAMPMQGMAMMMPSSSGTGGIKIILKNAKVSIEKVIIQKKE
ncbi:MAG: acetyl-CoA decarbonylase/synthase complex subunit beta, partial [Methanococcoides sp.]|nr:acetyl-CoA decarbonylase/synthase complex subunit beta [Methanococcoides sp.]